ncbi:unnamed protein product [Ectocarpus sp. 4 AP-2014]
MTRSRFFSSTEESRKSVFEVEPSAAPPAAAATVASATSRSNKGTKVASSGSSSSSGPASRWRRRLRRSHAHDFNETAAAASAAAGAAVVPEKPVIAAALSRDSLLGSGCLTEAPSSRGTSAETLSTCSPALESIADDGLDVDSFDLDGSESSWLEAELPPLQLPAAAAGANSQQQRKEQQQQQQRYVGPLELHVKDFECGECVGKGSYSKVFLGSHAPTGTEWALKVVSKRKTFETRENLMHLREERHISTKLQGSDFLVRTAGTFQNPRSVVFAMEYLPGGDLYQRLSDKGTLSLRETVAWTAQAVLAIEDLHAKNIVHRDVKPENFLMGKSGTLKLTDFGFARELAPDERLYSQFGTPEYVAAEVLSGCGHGMPVDLWALGVLIYELLVGQTPFKSPSVEEMYERIAAGDYAFPKPPASPACAAAEGSSSLKCLSSNTHKGGVQKQAFSLKKSDSSLSATASKKGGLAMAAGPNGADHTRQQAEPAKSKQAQRQEQGTADSNNSHSGGGAQDPAAQSLVKALLCLDPSRRPSLPEVKRHPFFAGVDFDGLREAVRAQADREEEEAVVAAAIEGGDVWVRGQPVVCQSDEINDNYGGVFVGF